MQTATPEDRACLQFALHVTIGIMPDTECYVLRDGQNYIIEGDPVVKLDPSRRVEDAVVVTLGQAMKFHLAGLGFGQMRNDLIHSGVDKQFADRVHYHLVDVSKEEWKRLKERVDWYRDDNASPIYTETENSGVS